MYVINRTTRPFRLAHTEREFLLFRLAFGSLSESRILNEFGNARGCRCAPAGKLSALQIGNSADISSRLSWSGKAC